MQTPTQGSMWEESHSLVGPSASPSREYTLPCDAATPAQINPTCFARTGLHDVSLFAPSLRTCLEAFKMSSLVLEAPCLSRGPSPPQYPRSAEL